jgi:hypothetical protein
VKRHVRTVNVSRRLGSSCGRGSLKAFPDRCRSVSGCLRDIAIEGFEASSHARIFEVHVRRILMAQLKDLHDL